MGKQFAVHESLRAPSAYPHDSSARSGIEHAETHISDLFFTRDRVYKFRKAVDLGFLDFSSLEERNQDCLREVALNRRLAPDVYLGVAPLEVSGHEARVGRVREDLGADAERRLEHCVVMRRLPDGKDAETRLRRGALQLEQIDALASRIARFHGEHRLLPSESPDAATLRDRVVRPAEENLKALARRGSHSDGRLRRVEERGRHFFRRAAPWLEKRRCLGLLVDGHGDLRLEHVWYERDEMPVVIDCVEFDAELRRTDPANDLGFLTMDLLRHGGARESQHLLQRYLWETDDFSLVAVLDHFTAYAACVRAKVASLRDETGDAARTDQLLELAAKVLEERPPPRLFLLCGVVGSGKSTVARALADATGGVIVASDRVRKRYADLFELDEADRYLEGWRNAVYDGLLERAEPIAASGRDVILDATFSRAARRARAQAWGEQRSARTIFVETRCTSHVVLKRLAQRRAAGGDVSDAGPERYEPSVAAFEPLEAGEDCEHWIVDTGSRFWRKALARELRALPR